MQNARIDIPRVTIAALRGGSGKTVLSIGIIAAFTQQGKTVAPFKKGPDYIDAGWLALAAGRPCYNLDTFMVAEPAVCHSFISHSADADIAVIEGNRGLYDGLDADGTTSTASLAKLINSPVILCLDCTKSTRTMAAVVLGCLHFDPEVTIEGVILNRIAGSRHEQVLRASIETHCGVKVIGAVPKLSAGDFPERHMGLIPTPEHQLANRSVENAARIVSNHVDVPEVLRIAAKWGKSPVACPPRSDARFSISSDHVPEKSDTAGRPKIGVIRDSAFQFYYPDNIEAIIAAGGEVVPVSPLKDQGLPDVDALYIGGGFPETHARILSENSRFRNELKSAADNGMPIYAECGGLMFLGESLVLDESYPMTGVLPVVFGFSKKPQGHGYTIISVNRDNPYYRKGTILKGHEFHYSHVLEWKGDAGDLVFTLSKGRGISGNRDGFCRKNVLATYSHIHALGVPDWADRLVKLAGGHDPGAKDQ